MLEVVKPDLARCGFVFGILEGWWLSKSSNVIYSKLTLDSKI